MGDFEFKVGDKVVLLGKWSVYAEYSVFTIKSIRKNYTYLDKNTTRIDFVEVSIWAEPRELRLLTPLERSMK